MARIAGVDLPREKRVDVALRYIYGIGPTKARQTVEALSIDATPALSAPFAIESDG